MKEKKKKKHFLLRFLFTLLIVLGILFGVAFGGLTFLLDGRLNAMQRTQAYTKKELNVASEVISYTRLRPVYNLAIFGVDNSGDYTATDRSDAMKILSVSPLTRAIKITSVQRDTLVWIPDPTNDYSKFNHAYWWGGAPLALKTLNMNLDLDLTRYVTFSFSALEQLVNLVGGVDIYLTQAEVYDMQLRNGTIYYDGDRVYHLDGSQAMAYCRVRYTDDDYHRMQRQNNVIQAILSNFKGFGFSKQLAIISDILPYVETNLSNTEIKLLILSAAICDLNHIDQYQVPEDGYNDINVLSYGGYSPLYKLRSYSDTIKNLHRFMYGSRNYQVSPQALQIEENIYATFGPFSE
ncbi:MAG: LCP family protein [Solobacterium sp.]|nr:LCP family protein [Solobacterium sp.]